VGARQTDHVVAILSDAWFALWTTEAADMTPAPGLTVSIEATLRRADAPARIFTTYFVDGVITAAGGADPTADLKAEVAEDVYRASTEGRTDAMERAILTGQMRLTGEPESLTLIGDLYRRGEWTEVRRRVHAQTEY
jgi:hypothetical protein